VSPFNVLLATVFAFDAEIDAESEAKKFGIVELDAVRLAAIRELALADVD
jgi:hypothetical protein